MRGYPPIPVLGHYANQTIQMQNGRRFWLTTLFDEYLSKPVGTGASDLGIFLLWTKDLRRIVDESENSQD